MELSLPLDVISQVDVARLVREVKGFDEFFVQAKVRQPNPALQVPKPSRLLEKIAVSNNYNLLNEQDCHKLAAQLDQIIGRAPLIHISFAAEPSPNVLESILSWFRSNIHPLTLLQVGLQPTIAAGCVLRTSNKVFDMSMRNYLTNQENYLVQLINSASSSS